jgi:hypothetical protein
VTIDRPRPVQRFVSAAMLRNNDELLMMLDSQHRQYAKGSKDDPYTQAAHNVRNWESNPRNMLRRQLIRYQQKSAHQLPLFPEQARLTLTNEQRAILDFWKGTPYEVRL